MNDGIALYNLTDTKKEFYARASIFFQIHQFLQNKMLIFVHFIQSIEIYILLCYNIWQCFTGRCAKCRRILTIN